MFLTASHHIFSIRTASVRFDNCFTSLGIFVKCVALRSHASAFHRSFLCPFLGGVIIAYVHNLSIKTSKQNNLYFDMSLETQDKLYRAVCFSPEKHQQCKARSDLSSPIKLTKYQLKRNAFTDQHEVHINKRSRLFEPASHKINFDIQQLEPVKQKKSVEVKCLHRQQIAKLIFLVKLPSKALKRPLFPKEKR